MSVAKVCYFLILPRIRVNKEVTLSRSSAPFRPCTKIGQNSKIRPQICPATPLFFGLFDLCGRTIGQLATLYTVPVSANVLFGLGRWRFGMVNDNLF